MAINMDGRAFADKMIDEIIVKAKCYSKKPGLAVIIIGDDKASRTYANGKRKDCEKCGFHYEEHILPDGTPERCVADLIYKLDDDPNITGIIVEMPLPTGFGRSTLLTIRPDKDIDCLSPYNNGMVDNGSVTFPPCTPEAVIELMDYYGINMSGRHCVVIGRSDVGKPLANMLLNRDATVTVCHSKTKDLASICRSADIILSAVGKPNLITADMVSDGAVVIDIAINRDPTTGKLCGDVDYGEVEKKASYITPVPGGIGPVTRVMLLRHLLYSGGIIGYGDI